MMMPPITTTNAMVKIVETEVSQKTPTDVNMDVRSDPFQDVRVLLKESEPIESEVTPEAPKKKKRGFF